MSPHPEIPEPSEELAADWAKKIIKLNKLTQESSFKKIAACVGSFVEGEFEGFIVSVTPITDGEYQFFFRSKGEDSSDLDLIDDIFGSDVEDTAETKMLSKYAQAAFEKTLLLLDIPNPKLYGIYLKKMKMRTFDSPPEFRLTVFKVWSKKIISYFKITKDTKLTEITKKIILFFDIIFPDYYIRYKKSKNENKYPILIDKKNDDTLHWLEVTTKIQKLVYCTHFQILTSLGRINDYPKDPEYWFEMVQIYEIMDLRNEANVFGNRALALNPTELTGLTELVEFYSEQKRFLDGLKYLKKSGEIILEKKQYKLALDIWKKVTNFESNVKENWLQLEKVYLAVGNESEAKKCREKIGRLK